MLVQQLPTIGLQRTWLSLAVFQESGIGITWFSRLHRPIKRCGAFIALLTKKTLNFRTHRVVSSREVLLLLGGVHPDLKGLGIGPIASYFCLNELYARGFRRATTHISAINAPIANLEIGNLGFRVIGAFAVLRKVYGDGL